MNKWMTTKVSSGAQYGEPFQLYCPPAGDGMMRSNTSLHPLWREINTSLMIFSNKNSIPWYFTLFTWLCAIDVPKESKAKNHSGPGFPLCLDSELESLKLDWMDRNCTRFSVQSECCDGTELQGVKRKKEKFKNYFFLVFSSLSFTHWRHAKAARQIQMQRYQSGCKWYHLKWK